MLPVNEQCIAIFERARATKSLRFHHLFDEAAVSWTAVNTSAVLLA